MTLAQKFFGRSDANDYVSEEEPFILYCAANSDSVESGTFLIQNLEGVACSSADPIHVGELVTYIAYALNLQNKVTHIVPYCGYTLLDLDYCHGKGMVWQAYFKVNECKLLIDSEVIHHFFLPFHERVDIRDRDNWTYALEVQDETPFRPATPPTPEYHPAPEPTPGIAKKSLLLAPEREEKYIQKFLR